MGGGLATVVLAWQAMPWGCLKADCAILRARAEIRQTLRGSPGLRDCKVFACRLPRRVLKNIEKSEQN
jgi:hypothetical protein